jgi:hypothetical protein
MDQLLIPAGQQRVMSWLFPLIRASHKQITRRN